MNRTMKNYFKHFFLTGFAAVSIGFAGCNDDDEAVIEPPVAGFTSDQNGATIAFTDTSTGDDLTYVWNFGDDTGDTQASPTKTYGSPGTYTVTLTVSNAGGEDSSSENYTVTAVDLDTEVPVITLIGAADTTIFLNDTWTDPGATALDNVDMDISNNIVVSGTVNTATAGTYTLTYDVSDAAGNAATSVTRTVNVTEDTEAPVVTLNGDAAVMIEIGTDFTDAGATATDNVDGDLTSSIVVTGEVNNLQPGVYTLTYTATDGAGNDGVATRSVTVTFDDGLLENGDFEADVAGNWFVNFGDNTVPINSDGGNSFFLVDNITNPDPNAVFLVNLSQVVTIELNKTYKLSFNASSDVNRDIVAGIGLNGGNFANTSLPVSITPTESRYEIELLANFVDPNIDERVLFDLNGAAGNVALDNVSLVEVTSNGGGGPTGDNLATNGDFEAGDISGWADFSDGKFSVVQTNPSSGTFAGRINNTQLAFGAVVKQANLAIGTVAVGDQISISFDARGTLSAGGVLFAEFFEEITPAGVSRSEILNGGNPITDLQADTWQTYTFTTSVQTDVSNGITLQLNAGTGGAAGSTADVYIDNIVISIVE